MPQRELRVVLTGGASIWSDDEWRAVMASSAINNLPDSDFAYIEPGGEKDSEGKTTPRSLRHFPIHDAAHVRNALARLSSSPFGAKAKPKVLAAAKKFGVEVSEKDAAEDLTETAVQSLLAQRSDLHHVREVRYQPFTDAEVRMSGAGEPPMFVGYASIFDSPYTVTDYLGEYSETITRGAFDKTISQGADVVFLINHEGSPLARSKSGTMTLRTDQKGLQVEARLDPANPRVAELRSMVERGDLDEMSFAFKALRQEWNTDYTERALQEVSLHGGDVSAVNFGANGATKGSLVMRSRQADLLSARGVLPVTQRQLGDAFRECIEIRAGAVMSGSTKATVTHALSLFATADHAVDEGQMILSELLGVTNPDSDDDSERSACDLTEKRSGATCTCCVQSGCDGGCCGTANADAASDSGDQPNADAPTTTLSKFEDYDYRIRIARLRGAA